MTDAHKRFDNEGSGGGIFVLGLLAGAAIGAGLGLLFAPKSGSDLRRHISEQAGDLANTASEGYKRAAGAVGEWADKGRELIGKAREVVARRRRRRALRARDRERSQRIAQELTRS